MKYCVPCASEKEHSGSVLLRQGFLVCPKLRNCDVLRSSTPSFFVADIAGGRTAFQAACFPVDSLVHQQQEVWKSWNDGYPGCNTGLCFFQLSISSTHVTPRKLVLCSCGHTVVASAVVAQNRGSPDRHRGIYLTSIPLVSVRRHGPHVT